MEADVAWADEFVWGETAIRAAGVIFDRECGSAAVDAGKEGIGVRLPNEADWAGGELIEVHVYADGRHTWLVAGSLSMEAATVRMVSA